MTRPKKFDKSEKFEESTKGRQEHKGSSDGALFNAKSAAGGKIIDPRLISKPPYTLIESVIGRRYLATKARTLGADDIQARIRASAFDVRGVHNFGTDKTTDRTAVSLIYESRRVLRLWFYRCREIIRNTRMHDELTTALSDDDHFADYLNLYCWEVGWLNLLCNLMKLYQYSDATSAAASDLAAYSSRIIALYRRASNLPMMPIIKAHAIWRSNIVDMSPHHELVITMPVLPVGSGDIYGGASDYGSVTWNWINNSTTFAQLYANLQAGLLALEGTITYDADVRADFIAIKDMMAAVGAVEGFEGTFVKGLPDLSALPGVVYDPSLLTEWMSRAFAVKETIGAATDQWIIFPNASNPALEGLIPVKSFGAQSPRDTLALGEAKFGFFESDKELAFADVNATGSFIGTDKQCQPATEIDVDTAFAGAGWEAWYTRNDGWGTASEYYGFDTASYAYTYLGKDYGRMKHIWNHALSLKRMSDYHFVDGHAGIMHEHWQPAVDLMPDWAQVLNNQMRLPPI